VSKLTVLIADDLKFFLEVEKNFLQRGGFEVLTAESGHKAVEIARQRRPHLILIDLEMPKMDGAAACAAMRQEPALAATPIILMSATGSEENRRRCLAAGCTEFVVKPQKPEELLGLVARVLAVKQRESKRITVVFNVAGTAAGKQVVGQARDLSEGGLLLETTEALAAGATLALEFYLPGSHHLVKVQAEVRRSDRAPDGTHRLGLRFIGLDPTDQEQILDYLAS
jgi:CheY-like chemotaxis protein